MSQGKIREITFPDGETRKVEALLFEATKEMWNEYITDAGVAIRMKTVVTKVYWVLDPQDNRMYNADGDPFLLVQSNNQVVASKT